MDILPIHLEKKVDTDIYSINDKRMDFLTI